MIFFPVWKVTFQFLWILLSTRKYINQNLQPSIITWSLWSSLTWTKSYLFCLFWLKLSFPTWSKCIKQEILMMNREHFSIKFLNCREQRSVFCSSICSASLLPFATFLWYMSFCSNYLTWTYCTKFYSSLNFQ